MYIPQNYVVSETVAAVVGRLAAADTDDGMVTADTDDTDDGMPGGSCITLLFWGVGGIKLFSAFLESKESRPFTSSVASFFTLHSLSC